ncbi:uncharacterized protein LOC119771131 [Culex quinquefasciatus]|uniref:uncharacterized protein LOC119771131 n=1 Tax=Culex quinquefasciatus TaxID=7176 RepID=UPI0018E33CF3|nr:uncharacterized protein LOC119771131 [Culex quinquefasciatus]
MPLQQVIQSFDINNRRKMFEILKRSWNSQETPPWFNELITETIEIYKQKSEQLPASDNELSEFHEQVMSLNYELGLLWENYWSEYEFDLATVRNYLQKCIEYFEKLPNDYVDPAMKIDRDEAANILSDINENNQKLQTSLVESSPLERIQLLINLGQLPENDIIPENLKTISDQKQEVLLQQIRCMQLARLINTMEEDELFTSFQGAELNDEQASTLMNARQLATTNQLPTDDCGEDVNERLIYGAVKERILQMIRSEIRENKASLTQVKTNIEEYFKTKLGLPKESFLFNPFHLKHCKTTKICLRFGHRNPISIPAAARRRDPGRTQCIALIAATVEPFVICLGKLIKAGCEIELTSTDASVKPHIRERGCNLQTNHSRSSTWG